MYYILHYICFFQPDETVSERLWGLTEMFPESVRNLTYSTVVNTKSGICKFYSLSRGAAWVVFSTSIILFAPVIFEVERANMEEMQRSQQKQVIMCELMNFYILNVKPQFPKIMNSNNSKL